MQHSLTEEQAIGAARAYAGAIGQGFEEEQLIEMLLADLRGDQHWLHEGIEDEVRQRGVWRALHYTRRELPRGISQDDATQSLKRALAMIVFADEADLLADVAAEKYMDAVGLAHQGYSDEEMRQALLAELRGAPHWAHKDLGKRKRKRGVADAVQYTRKHLEKVLDDPTDEYAREWLITRLSNLVGRGPYPGPSGAATNPDDVSRTKDRMLSFHPKG